MAGPPAKALGPDGLVKNISRQTCNMLWFLIVSNENTVVIRKGGGNHSKCDWQAQIYNRALSLSAADFLRLMPKFIFLGVELPELQLMDWPDAQVIATVWTSICLCLSRRGGQWLELDQSENSYIWNEMYNIAIDSCCTPLSIEPI